MRYIVINNPWASGHLQLLLAAHYGYAPKCADIRVQSAHIFINKQRSIVVCAFADAIGITSNAVLDIIAEQFDEFSCQFQRIAILNADLGMLSYRTIDDHSWP